MFQHFIALGDSLTEGYGDEVTGLEKRSWVDYIVEHFCIPTYANLARTGLRSDEVFHKQFSQVMERTPDLVSVIAGGNDIIQKRYFSYTYQKRMERMICHFSQKNAVVITSNFPDFTRFITLQKPLKWMLKKQLQSCNKVIDTLAHQYNTVHFDFWNNQLFYNEQYLSEDRVHPNALGYKKIAEVVIERLEQCHDRNVHNVFYTK
ncbi:MAG: SGNH/GDSL hydrolase family protein [Bacillaceae bacterium]